MVALREILKTSTYFSVLTILISTLGVFALSLLKAYQRKREIGIRKVIGAEFKDIALLFSKEYMLLIFVALTIITPIVWYLMNDWLNGFVTHVSFNVYLFIYVGIFFTGMALLSILLSIGKIARGKSVDLIK